MLARGSYRLLTAFSMALLAACGGSGGDGSSTSGVVADQVSNINADGSAQGGVVAPPNAVQVSGADGKSVAPSELPDRPTTRLDASRFLNQASFGSTSTTLEDVARKGARKALTEQFALPASRYGYTLSGNAYRASIHTAGLKDFCAQYADDTPERTNCWRDWYTPIPVQQDFFKQGASANDQLRQRMAFTLGQIFVVSHVQVAGAYGFAEYNQLLRDLAFSDFRTLLRGVTLHPLMGQYLNMVNNDGASPNENYAREMMQLFSIGTCLLNQDGSLQGGKCTQTYGNDTVRAHAYAMSGFTFPKGGVDPYCSGCKSWKNPVFLRGPMVGVPDKHDKEQRVLLGGVKSATATPEQGLDAVLDAIMAHPNVAPFIGKKLIQAFVTSNPTPAYVARVSKVFSEGVYSDADGRIGSGRRGDLQAVLAAILLDGEARDPARAEDASYGRLRDPVAYSISGVRALSGYTDGRYMGLWGWGTTLGQPIFNAPSVFNFYPDDYPLDGTSLVGPGFGIANTNTLLARYNFTNDLIFWWYGQGNGLAPDASMQGAIGTKLNYGLESLIVDPAKDSKKVVDQLNELLMGGRLPATHQAAIIAAMDQWKPSDDSWLTKDNNRSNYRRERLKTAAYLILSSAEYQIQR